MKKRKPEVTSDPAHHQAFTNFAELPTVAVATSAVEAADSFDTSASVVARVGLARRRRHWRRQEVQC